MTRKNQLSIFIFKIIPKGLLSRLFGSLAQLHLPAWIISRFIPWYSRTYGVLDEYNVPEGGFQTLNAFFTRSLKKGAHVIDPGKTAVVSPVDARVDQYGDINGERVLQAKGCTYSLLDLIPSENAKAFINGSFITLYLSPGDYHRIHAPVTGTITGFFAIPGTLFPVKEFMVNGLTGLFTLNERLITYIKTPRGLAAVCKIGAMNVGKITLSYEDVATNQFLGKRREVLYAPDRARPVRKGDEIGTFNLGSTVILLFQKGVMKVDRLEIGAKVRMGQRIGSLTGR